MFIFYLLLSYKWFDFWGDFFLFKTLLFFFCDPIRDPIHDPVRDPVRDPIQSDPGFVNAGEYSHLCNVQILSTWMPIVELTWQFRLYKRNQVQVLCRQFPLRPAAAKTIHRCQGDTLDAAVVDLPASTREHMHYVGLGRLRNISGLHILNLSEKKIAVSKEVAAEMSWLRSEASLKPCIPFLYETPSNENNLKILFQNVRSLHLHIEDVVAIVYISITKEEFQKRLWMSR